MRLHFAATGNFKQLRASLHGINRQASQSMSTVKKASAAATPALAAMSMQAKNASQAYEGLGKASAKVTPLLNQMQRAQATTGRYNTQMTRTLMKNRKSVIRDYKSIMNAQSNMVMDSRGNARVFMDVNRSAAENAATLGDKFRFTNTVLHGFSRNLVAVGKNIQWAGRQVTVGLTVPLGIAATVARNAAMEYNRQFTRILKVNNEASIAASGTAEQFDMVSDSIRRQTDRLVEMGAAVGFMSNETSAMIAELSQMGYIGSELNRLSEASLRLSRTGGTDLTTSLELSRLTAQAFNVPLDQLTQTFARLNIVENNTALSLEELAKAMPVVAGVASTMGMEIEETAGLMAMMKENGIGGNEGATALRTGLLRIVQDATDPAIEAFEKINLNLVEMQERMAAGTDELEAGDIMIFFDELSVRLKSMEGNQAQLNEFAAAISKMVGVRSSARFLSFLTEVGDRFDENTSAGRAWLGVLSDTEEAMRIFEFEEQQVAESTAGIADRLKAELNLELVKVGENFIETSNKLMQGLVNILRGFNNLEDGTKQMILGMAGLVALLGPATMLFGIMANAIGQIGTILTKIFRPMTMHTIETRAQVVAHQKAAEAAIAEAAAQSRLATARNAAAGAAAKNVAATSTMSQASAARTTTMNTTTSGMAGAGFFDVGKSMANIGKVGRVLKTVAFLAKGLLGLAAAFAAVSITFSNNAFFQGIKDVAGGSMQALVDQFRSFGDSMGMITDRMRQLGQDSESVLARIATLLGNITGGALFALNKGLQWTIALLERVGEAGGVLIDVANYVVQVMEGNSEEAQESWDSAGDTIVSWMDRINQHTSPINASIADGWVTALEYVQERVGTTNGLMEWMIGNAERAAEGYRNLGRHAEYNVQRWEKLQGWIVRNNEALRENANLLQLTSNNAEDSEQFMEGLADAGVDVENLTENSIMQNEMLTDELRAQLLQALAYRDAMSDIVALEAEIVRIRGIMRQIAAAGGEGGMIWDSLQQQLTDVQDEFDEITERVNNTYEDHMAGLEAQRAAQALSGETQEDVTQEFENTTDAAEDLQDELDAINSKIAESERVAKAWASELRGSVGEVMSDIEQSVLDALGAQRESMEAGFDEREESIESAADAELERLDAIEEREAELEKQRKRWFEQQKARIDYLKDMEQQNVRMGEMVARGDLAEASVIRIGLQRDAEEYMLESYEREAEKHKETKRDELEQKREAVEESKRLTLEQLEVEQAAAQAAFEARERGIRLYLESWRQTIPTTEEEFNRHTGRLASKMSTFGINMSNIAFHYSDISGRHIYNGWASAIAQAESALAQDERWRNLGERTGSAYREGLAAEAAKIEGVLGDIRDGVGASSSGSSSSGSGLEYSGPTGADNFTRSQYRAYRGLSSPSSSSTYGPTAPSLNLSGGSGGSGSTSYSPSTPDHLGPGNTIALPSSRTRGFGSSIFSRHSGGDIDGRPNMPGLKRDESAYVLQHGEYVVQRDAVKALGLDYMERINQAKRHDGGLIDYSMNSLREAGAGKSIAGYAFGKLASLAAADIVRSNGGDPKMTSQDTATRGAREAGKMAGLQLAEVVKSFAQQGALGSGTDWRRSSDGYPPRRWAQISANTRAAQQYFRAQGGFPGGIGAGVHRGVQKSDHSWGKALDFMVAPLGRYARGEQKERGWQVANWHIQNPKAFGTKYVIWDKKINSGDARGWRDYSRYGDNPGPTLGHYDHVHVSYLHDGGLAGMEGLRKGGKIRFDDSVARLHRGETVVDAAGTRSMENAVKLLTENAGGGGNVYELNIKVEGGNMDEQRLAKAVMREIETAEVKHGRKRVVKG